MKTFTVRERATKGIELNFRKNATSSVCGVSLGSKMLARLSKAGVQEAKTVLHWLDVEEENEDLRLVPEENIKDRRALVLVETVPGLGGSIWLTSNDVISKVDASTERVIRESPPKTPNTGVQVLAQAASDTIGSGVHFLVSMLPGASFKIVRTGNLEGAPSEIVVSWSGKWDYKGYMAELARQQQEIQEGRYPDDLSMQYWGLAVFGKKAKQS